MKRAALVALALALVTCRNVPEIVAPDACSDVARVAITARNELNQLVASAPVGATLRLDATPQNAEGLPVNQVCHSPAVVWRWTTANCTVFYDTSGFNPLLSADAVGFCELRAIVGAVTGELTLKITP